MLFEHIKKKDSYDTVFIIYLIMISLFLLFITFVIGYILKQ